MATKNDKLVDLVTERACLSGIANYGTEGYDEIADIVDEHTFSDEYNQVFFKCFIHSLKDDTRKLDLASIMAAATALGYQHILGQNNERKLLRAIMLFPVERDNLRKLAGRIKKLQLARDLLKRIELSKKAIQDITGDEPIDNILAMAESPIIEFTNELMNSQGSRPELMGKGLREYIDYLQANVVEAVGIATPYPNYNNAIGGGLRKKTINLIGARAKIGKTSLGDNVAIHVASNLNIPVLNIDTEMSLEDHRVRILANLSGVPIDEIEKGVFGQNTFKIQQIKKAVDKLEKMPYYYESVAGKPFEEILSAMRYWIKRKVGKDENGQTKPCLIIYDYLKLMGTEGLKDLQEYQLLGFQISALHNFMVTHDVPCLAFIQLNRDGINKEDTSVISGSDRQVWICSNFSIFKPKSDDEVAQDPKAGNRKLVPMVARHGAGLDEGDYINMQFTGQFNKITEGKTRNQLKIQQSTQSQGFVNDVSKNETVKF